MIPATLMVLGLVALFGGVGFGIYCGIAWVLQAITT